MQHTANAYHMDFDRAATTHAAAASGPSTPSSTTSHPQFHVLHHQASQQPAFELDSRGSVVSSVGSVDSTFHVQAFATFDHGFPTAGMEGFSFASQGMSDAASPTLGAGAAAASEAHHLLGGLPEVNVALPRGTVHTALHGNVTFVPYPQTVGEVQRFLAQTAARREEAARAGYFPGPRNTRAFIGQLPYNVTEMQLLWICAFFGGDVAQPQRITKTSESGEKIPTGAVHVMCDGYSYQVLSNMMHKRVLVDDTGLWFAQTPAQKANLDSYVAYLHTHKKARKPGRPYESVVIQVANSTFVPRRAMQFDATRR